MIVTGEASGDLHGANLVKAMLLRDPQLVFSGMGGPELAAAGVSILYDAGKVAVVGIIEVISHLGDIRAAQKILKQHMTDHRPALLIVIDLPDFNLLLAKKAKELGIPVFYYISPQVWAWRSGRVKTISERVDTVGVILPFEEQFFRERGVKAEYVGHPLLDTVHVTESRSEFFRSNGIDPNGRCVGLLPGSRIKEISMLLPVFLAAAEQLQTMSGDKITFLIPLASTISEDELRQQGLAPYEERLTIKIIRENRYNMMAVCDAVVAASGTVTLELALLDIPMVVAYKVAPLTYTIGRLLIKLKHFSLVNLIAGESVVPELLQNQVTQARVAEEIHNLIYDDMTRTKMKRGLAVVREQLGEHGASAKAAQLALQMIAGQDR